MSMKVITIIQPWATLIALGEKQFETRSWATKHRGELAIHAGKKIDKEACREPEIRKALERHGYTEDNLPTGAVVAICNLTECWGVIGIADVPVKETHVLSAGNRMFGMTRAIKEFHFGDYSEGRYAWELADVNQLSEPIPAKGQQGLWNWEGVQL
jgi:activating signal cointegrator 1